MLREEVFDSDLRSDSDHVALPSCVATYRYWQAMAMNAVVYMRGSLVEATVCEGKMERFSARL